MNQREKILALVTGTMVVAFLGYLMVDRLLLTPSSELDSKARSLRKKIADLRQKVGQEKRYHAELDAVKKHTFGTDENKAGNALLRRLQYLLSRAGFNDENQTLTPMAGRSQAGIYREIGRKGTAAGTLANVVDFLYLLKHEPMLHRLDNLVITPKGQGRVNMQFRYSTLVLDAKKGYKLPTSMPADAIPKEVDLNVKDRKLYNVIVSRDLFRPYIPKPKPVIIARPPMPRPTPPTPRPVPRPVTPTAPPSAGVYKITGLSTWAGLPEVMVTNTQTQQTRTYKPGDLLAKGRIVMVEHKDRPMPGKPMLMSGSRVIIEIKPDYWAIELGQTLLQKRRLSPDQLPPSLRAPATESEPAGEKTSAKQTG